MAQSRHGELLKRLLPPVSYDLNAAGVDAACTIDGLTLDRVEEAAPQILGGLTPLQDLRWLEDYERVYALPSPCFKGARTLEQRILDVSLALLERLAINREFYIKLAAMWGYTVKIREYRPFTPGSQAGESLTNGQWRYVWMLESKGNGVRRFKAGRSCAGEALAAWGNEEFECFFKRLAPAHTKLLFSYAE